MSNPGAPRVVMITGADSGYMHLLRGMIETFVDDPRAAGIAMRCLDLGLNEEDRRWLSDHGVECFLPQWHFGIREGQFPRTQIGFLVRPYLRDYLPGYDIYLWLDCDLWIQDWDAIQRFLDGARETGLAIARESHPGYRLQIWLYRWMLKHWVLGYGVLDGPWLLTRTHMNAGLFAMTADAPHWALWEDLFRRTYERTGLIIPHDQFALNRVIQGGLFDRPKVATTILPATCNWICDRGIPMWSDTAQAFCEPVAPFAPIGVLHLAGPAKRTEYDIRRTAGGSFRTRILHGAAPAR